MKLTELHNAATLSKLSSTEQTINIHSDIIKLKRDIQQLKLQNSELENEFKTFSKKVIVLITRLMHKPNKSISEHEINQMIKNQK